jgi:hypothetical protein
MARPSPIASASSAVDLTTLVEIVHDASAGQLGPTLIEVAERQREVTLQLWPIPDGIAHPADVLLGYRTPPATTIIGLASSGRTFPLAEVPAAPVGRLRAAGPPSGARFTVLVARDGRGASRLQDDAGGIRTLDEPPQGWVADALARALGVATPAPDVSLATYVEAAWLDAVVDRTLRTSPTPDWDELALLHPLAPAGGPSTPEHLAGEVRALCIESNWGCLRLRFPERSGFDGIERIRPPGATPVPIDEWFDDGSFARWVVGNQIPGHVLFAELTALLDPLVTARLAQALTSLGPDHDADPPAPG